MFRNRILLKRAKNIYYGNILTANKALKLTAPSVHAFCFSTGVESLGPWAQKRAPRPAA